MGNNKFFINKIYKGITKYKTQLVGAAATAVGWLGFSYVFSIYIMHYSRYSFLYGSLAAIVLLMLWVYFCVYMLLIGAELNKHIDNGFFRRLKYLVFKRRKTAADAYVKRGRKSGT